MRIIQVLHVPDCPNVAVAHGRVREALAKAGVKATVEEHEVATEEEARRVGMNGSPTILIDGRDVIAGGEPSLACRLYRHDGGTEGSPTVDSLVEALETANPQAL